MKRGQENTLLGFINQESKRDVLTLGVGSAGCRIVCQIQDSEGVKGRFAYISTEEKDLNYSDTGEKVLIENGFDGKTSPFNIRGKAYKSYENIKKLIDGSKLLFIVAGLGGSVGSGIAPLISEISKKSGLLTICLTVMPYSYEKDKHFYAGTALKKIRERADGVIIVDNDELLRNVPTRPVLETYKLVNRRIAEALNAVAGETASGELDTGLNSLMQTIIQDKYAILSVFESSAVNACEEAVVGAVQSVYRITDPNSTRNVILHMIGDGQTSVGDMAMSVNRANSLLGDGSLKVHSGVSVGVGNGLTAIMIASGFKNTKFDDYDPLDNILKTQLDDSLNSNISVELPELSSVE
mgnify:CR=1 FL=1